MTYKKLGDKHFESFLNPQHIECNALLQVCHFLIRITPFVCAKQKRDTDTNKNCCFVILNPNNPYSFLKTNLHTDTRKLIMSSNRVLLVCLILGIVMTAITDDTALSRNYSYIGEFCTPIYFAKLPCLQQFCAEIDYEIHVLNEQNGSTVEKLKKLQVDKSLIPSNAVINLLGIMNIPIPLRL